MAEEYRNFVGEIRNLKKSNEFIYEVEIWLLNEKTNRNNWQYTNIRGNKDQFAGTPILIAYVNNGNTIGSGHNFEMEYDADGNEAPSFTAATAERIIGALSEKTEDIRIEEDADGTEWVVGKGYIWKWYAKEAVEKIERDSAMGHPMSISIETLVFKSRTNEEGVEVEEEYKILGTTILGDGVAPAVENARIVALNELASEFKELKLRAASYTGNSEEEEEKEEETDAPEETQNENKTQKSNEKGERTVKAFSKKQIAELSTRFDGYRVLAAGQDDNGIHLCIMAENGDTAVYTMENLTDPVDVEKIRKCEAQAVFTVDEWELAVDASELTDSLSATIVNTQSALEEANENLSKANQTIEEMTSKEMKRRVSAAKAKAIAVLEAFNANRESKVDAKVLEAINEAIENGDFSECENAEGEWCGESAVENQVLAACAKEVMELDKHSAMQRNSQFVWDGVAKNAHPVNDGGISELLSKFNVK